MLFNEQQQAEEAAEADQFLQDKYAHPVEKFMMDKSRKNYFKKMDQTHKLSAYKKWI